MAEPATQLLRDYASELRAILATASAGGGQDDFARGRRFGIYEALSLLLNQIDAFDVDRLELGVAEMNAEALLLGRAD